MKFLMLSVVLLLASCGKEEAKVAPAAERAKDPVCGMWVVKNGALFTAFDNAYYFFCANECVAAFTKEPTKYTHLCDCKKTQKDCKCEHCRGVMTPCDCKN